MDEFGVLVERYGVKVQGGKSTPMANLKSKTTNSNNGFPSNVGYNNPGKNSGYGSDPFVGNDLDGIFKSSKTYGDINNDNDIFGGVFANSNNNVDIEAVLGGGSVNNNNYGGSNKSNLYNDDFDLFGTPKKSERIDDLFGNLGLKMEKDQVGKRSGGDDLIPGFGDFSSPSYGKKLDPKSSQQSNSSKSSSSSPDDPFLVFESSARESNASSWPFSESSEHQPGSSSVTSTIDELEDFAYFKVRSNTKEGLQDTKRDASVKKPVDRAQDKSKNIRVTINKPSKTTKPKPAAEGHVSAFFHEKGGRPEKNKSSSSRKNVSPVKNFVDDLMSFGDFAPTSEVFQEVEGESEERRRARMKNHMKTQERMAKALAEKTQRDLQSQNEQEEKHRLAEMLEYDLKLWATGKEGNLRALLSSLQHVLWPECGWQPVSLTYLITSTSVKKVYHRATLCVHPDKVQQKGATVRQKYIAEKVFDLLKEAWNKFNTEELR